ncbi:MAG: MMPL family transporter, partial [Solirubrobacteraceae bacterium]
MIVSWVVVAVAATALASAAGRNYSTNFTLPGTETQRVSDLLTREFPAQSGDIDTIVFRTTSGSVRDPAVRAVIEPLLAKVAQMPHVAAVVSPYSPAGGLQVSRDGRTAFASVAYDKRANLLPDTTGKPLIADVQAIKQPGLKVAAGGQVVEQAEGFNIGPATEIGVVAALVILLLTFGSLLAAGMPLVTAGIGLITGVALIGLATHVMSMSNVAPQLALMIGLGVGIDYALFIVTRFREEYARTGDVERSVLIAMNTSGRAILLAGTTVMIALLGMFALGVSFMYGLATASVLAVLLTMMTSLTVLPALLSKFGARVGARQRRQATDESARPGSAWRRWSETVQARPWPLALASLALIVVLMVPVVALRMENSDAGNDPPAKTSRQAFDLLAAGFGAGFNGPLLIAAQLHSPAQLAGLAAVRSAVASTPDVGAVGRPQLSPSGRVAVLRAYPITAAQAQATTDLVNRLRNKVLPPYAHRTGTTLLVGGFTAGSIDFSRVLS